MLLQNFLPIFWIDVDRNKFGEDGRPKRGTSVKQRPNSPEKQDDHLLYPGERSQDSSQILVYHFTGHATVVFCILASLILPNDEVYHFIPRAKQEKLKSCQSVQWTSC